MGNKDDGKANGRLKRKQYEKELSRLQAELCKLQDWVKYKGLRVVVVFEGRDAAGKGGTMRAITERVSPRVFRLVALPAPSDREESQIYIQRYIRHFPAAGRDVIVERSCYNRADLESFRRWYEYSRARDEMLKATDTKHAPWYIVRSDDKRRARLNCISHLLSMIPYGKVPRETVKLPKRKDKESYDDQAPLRARHFVAEKF